LLVALFTFSLPSDDADAAGVNIQKAYSTSVVCPPPNIYSPDGGAGKVTGKVLCADGYSSFRLESESTTAAWIGFCPNGVAKAGCMNAENYTTTGNKRCLTNCGNGSAFPADVYGPGNAHCVSAATNDAGVTLAVTCGR
jgi:hypothetical protein